MANLSLAGEDGIISCVALALIFETFSVARPQAGGVGVADDEIWFRGFVGPSLNVLYLCMYSTYVVHTCSQSVTSPTLPLSAVKKGPKTPGDGSCGVSSSRLLLGALTCVLV